MSSIVEQTAQVRLPTAFESPAPPEFVRDVVERVSVVMRLVPLGIPGRDGVSPTVPRGSPSAKRRRSTWRSTKPFSTMSTGARPCFPIPTSDPCNRVGKTRRKPGSGGRACRDDRNSLLHAHRYTQTQRRKSGIDSREFRFVIGVPRLAGRGRRHARAAIKPPRRRSTAFRLRLD